MKIKQASLAVALAMSLAGLAHASFYVAEDMAPVPLAVNQFPPKNKTVYVSFNGQKLSGYARAELETVADATASTDQVTVLAFVKTAKQLSAAKLRVASVRALLVRRGISSDAIVTNTELDPQVDSTDMDVQVTFRFQPPRTPADVAGIQRTAKTISSPPPPPVAVAASPINTGIMPIATPSADSAVSKLELIKKIMAMASAKLISQESAVKLVNEYLASAPVPAPSHLPGSQSIPAAPQIVPFGEVPRVWTLAANKSLQDNIREWAVTAGYHEPVWLASNPYQVTYTSNYSGTFVEVLNQLSTAVPSLDFRLAKTARRLEVVDHR